MVGRRLPSWGMTAVVVVAMACEKTPVVPTVVLGQDFTLAPRHPVRTDDGGLRLEFLQVTGDSRCPVDAVCVLGGDAVVEVRLTGRAVSEAQLHTGDASRAVVEFEGYTIRLSELQPYPFSGRTTPQDDYRATLRVTK